MWHGAQAELPPLQRRALRDWHGLALRIGLALSLIVLAFAILWFDRGGLRDNLDGHLTFADVIYFTMITVTTVGYGDIVPISERARLIDAFLITPIRIFLWLIFLGTAAEFLLKRSWENWRMRRIQQTLHDHVVLQALAAAARKQWKNCFRLARKSARSSSSTVMLKPSNSRRRRVLLPFTTTRRAMRCKRLSISSAHAA